MPKALITGCTGQDGSYLTEFLLAKGYEVHGVKRRSSSLNTDRLDHIYEDFHEAGTRFFLHYADLTDGSSLTALLHALQPDEIYNLGAQSHVKVSFEVPEFTADVVACGTLRLLEAMRRTGVKSRFYQASSSEMFGNAPPPQSETTAFHPRSPYACAKVFGHNITVNYRESYGLHASSGILFNHESPRRGETFVTRKITRAVAHIKLGVQQKLYLGNLDARRDWGYAPDYVRAMWLMLQQDTAGRLRCRHRRGSHGARIRGAGIRAAPVWIGRSTWRSTRATSGRPRWITCCADASKARQGAGLGADGEISTNWCGSWWMRT